MICGVGARHQLVLLALALGALVGCARAEDASSSVEIRRQVEVRREAGLDVLLITVDTLRADALGSYGNPRAETPWMDRLAAGGARFTTAYAHNVVTLPTHASILSGLLPHQHGVRDNSGFRFPDDVSTLATRLAGEGYRTGAFVSAFPLDSRFGLDRGFEIYEDSFTAATARPLFLEQERRGTETVALARRWLAAGDGRPTFCWVHLYEPHYPYAPPEPWAGRFGDAPYHGDVAAADAALTPLLEPLLAAGETGRTLVVLTSDHGEALGEHGEATHGIFAYEATLAVPLILYQPRIFPPGVISTPARHVDILPTVLDALALPLPPLLDLAGHSLLAAAAGAAEEEPPPVYFEALSGQLNRGWAPLYGVIYEGFKYIDLPIPELYSLESDPGEEDNLAAREPQRVAELARVLTGLRGGERPTERSAEDDETRRRLAALGYLAGGAPTTRAPYTAADDPKRLLGLDTGLRQITALHAAGDLAAALERSRRLVRQRTGMRIALVQLAQLERESGNLAAAVEAMREAYTLQPDDSTILAGLAALLAQAGRAEEAVAVTAPHVQGSEPDVEVLLIRGLVLARSGRAEEALAMFDQAGVIDPDNPMVAVHRGTYHLLGGRRREARAAYEEALAMQPGVVAAHTALALMAVEEGRIDESLDHWRQAVTADPREHRKLLAVGTSGWNAGHREQARPLLELFVESAPPRRYAAEIARVRSQLSAATGGRAR